MPIHLPNIIPDKINIGEPNQSTNLEISYASKKAVEVLEKLGGKIKLTKK